MGRLTWARLQQLQEPALPSKLGLGVKILLTITNVFTQLHEYDYMYNST